MYASIMIGVYPLGGTSHGPLRRSLAFVTCSALVCFGGQCRCFYSASNFQIAKS